MSQSERLQRRQEHTCYHDYSDRDLDKVDEELAERIRLLLNNDFIDKYSMVDAYYYDYSVIPYEVLDSEGLYRDAYLIYGITSKGQIISKWVDRWDLDSQDPIVDGKVIHPDVSHSSFTTSSVPPPIAQAFSSNLLSTPESTMICKGFYFLGDDVKKDD